MQSMVETMTRRAVNTFRAQCSRLSSSGVGRRCRTGEFPRRNLRHVVESAGDQKRRLCRPYATPDTRFRLTALDLHGHSSPEL
jgi:hypothetical protein